jgi:spoIIIJ-associated protein
MSGEKRDFFGKEVAEAIGNACDTLGVAQERLDIEVVETGSTGIFGLIRKKAHIRVQLKSAGQEIEENLFAVGAMLRDSARAVGDAEGDDTEPLPEVDGAEGVDEDSGDEEDDDAALELDDDAGEEATPESLAVIREELLEMVRLMGMPSSLTIESKGLGVVCTLTGAYEEELTGTDGKVLDSLQYLIRKVVSRKVNQRLKISVNVGEFREKRLDELKSRALALAEQVKENGKSQTLPALNPSERRAVHMVLQEDKEIRSRSVGDGLFKKILIYKPGKGNRPNGGRRRPQKSKNAKSGQDTPQGGEA